MNMVSGQGMVNILSDDGIQINVQHAIDSSFVETRPLLQSGATLLCASLDGSPSNYSCSMTPSLRDYVTGMVIHWRPDVDGAGGPTTLNIDGAGIRTIKLIDGRDPSPADIIAGYQYDLWFDGFTFRMKTPVGVAISAAIPPCTVAERARLWLTPGPIGVKDTVSICAKDSSDTYAWRPLY